MQSFHMFYCIRFPRYPYERATDQARMTSNMTFRPLSSHTLWLVVFYSGFLLPETLTDAT